VEQGTNGRRPVRWWLLPPPIDFDFVGTLALTAGATPGPTSQTAQTHTASGLPAARHRADHRERL